MSVTPDTSVLVAGADPEHSFFPLADEAMTRVRETGGRLVAHTVAETYAVLSGGLRHPSAVAAGYLEQFFGPAAVGLSPDLVAETVFELSGLGLVGAAIYDGLIAVSAREAGLTLLSLDLRARRTYERCGVEYELLLED